MASNSVSGPLGSESQPIAQVHIQNCPPDQCGRDLKGCTRPSAGLASSGPEEEGSTELGALSRPSSGPI